jgi:hypothetical protein
VVLHTYDQDSGEQPRITPAPLESNRLVPPRCHVGPSGPCCLGTDKVNGGASETAYSHCNNNVLFSLRPILILLLGH